jgi:protein SCO1
MSYAVRLGMIVLLVASGVSSPDGVHAQRRQPPAAREVGVTEQIGSQLPLDLRFRTAQGASVDLAHYVRGDLPVLLVLAYARCELLCSLVLRGLSEAVRTLEARVLGRDYRLVLVSLDPDESLEAAQKKQSALTERVGYRGETWRWPYLLSRDESVSKLAAALGFRYARDAQSGQIAHPAVAFALTPDGRIARYLYGIAPERELLASALEQAAAGRLSTALESELLRCFRFDPGARKHASVIQAYFRLGASAIFLLLAALLITLFVWERARRP